jgi:multiple sugar transport system permease protein
MTRRLALALVLFVAFDARPGVIVENEEYQGEKVTVRYAMYGEAGEVKYIRDIARQFVERYPHIRVEVSVYPWGQYWAKLQVQSGSGLAPDVITLYSGVIGVWAARGALTPLDEFVDNSETSLDDYHGIAVEACTWDDKLYAFPLDVAVRAVIYKKDVLEQSGVPESEFPRVDEPLTWGEFAALAARLTHRNPDGSFAQYGMVGGLSWNEPMWRMFGGDVLDRQINPTKATVVGNDSLIAAMIEVFKLQYGDRVHLGDAPLQSGNVNLSSILFDDQFAMGIDGPWTLRNLEERGVRYGLTPMPRGPRPSQLADVNAVAVFSGSAHKEEAWLFVEHLASLGAQRIYGRRLRGVPSLKAASDALVNNDYGAADVEAYLHDLPIAAPNMVTDNNYLVPVLDKWRLRVERELEKEYNDRLAELPRVNGEIPPEAYERFVAHMNEFIEAKIRERIPELQADFDEAFERGKPLDPDATVKYVFPAALLLFFGLLGWLYFRYVRSNRKTEAKSGGGRGGGAKGYAVISPWLIGFTAFLVGPILASVVLSFTEWNLIESPRWIGVAHYLSLAEDENFLIGLERTIRYAAFAVPIAMFGGLFTAALLTAGVRGSNFFKAVFYFPSLFTGAAAAIVWINMFNKDYGVINHFLTTLGFEAVNWLDEAHAFYAVVLMNLFWIGNSMIIYYAGMKQIPQSLYEAAEIDGAGFLRRFVFVTIPLLGPVVVFTLVITTIMAFQVFTPALFFAQSSSAIGEPGDALRFYAVNIYDEAFNKLHMGRACSYAMILFLVIFAVTSLQMKLSKRLTYYDE